VSTPPERAAYPDRIVHFRPRTIFAILGILVALGVVLWLLWLSRHVLTWVVISLFLAMALNPAVEWLLAHGVKRRGSAVGIVFLLAIAVVAGLAALLIPPLVDQVNALASAAPGYIDDLTKGRGHLGFLETKYHVVEKVKASVESGGVRRALGGAGFALSVTKSVLTAIAALVTIVFMTLFMLLDGPDLTDKLFKLLPEHLEPRWRRIGRDIYRTVGGYVTGNLLISVIAGAASWIVLAIIGVPYPAALATLVAILDLIPLAGATLAAIVVVLVTLAANDLTAAIIVAVYFVVYQQLENHVLQPLVYGKTVRLPPLAVLVAVLIGAQIAGVVGALGAIPVAGALQVLLVDWQQNRRRPTVSGTVEPSGSTSDVPAA
jgi:predicted PurR-regulated permease PerM